MNNLEMLSILKKDLQMITSANDEYLEQLLEFAKEAIEREGVKLDGGIECDMVKIQYAAYLFRKRGGEETSMPRFLRLQLNNMKLGGRKKDDI